MRILLANKYFFLKGGAEHSFFQTARILRKKGHKVIFFSMKHPDNFPSEYEDYFISNVDFEDESLKNILRASGRILYSFEAKHKIEKLLLEEIPEIAHINNVYHQVSPSFLKTLKQYRIPIIMTLRDYKVVCASYAMLANKQPCEACKNGKYYHCLLKGCVKDSHLKSLLSTFEMYLHHRILHLYNLVDVFISPSQFLKNKLKEMGFDKKVVHLPNFVPVDKFEPEYDWEERSIIYYGRLSSEKGLFTLLEAVKDIKDVRLKIVGDGPLRESLEQEVRSWDAGSQGKVDFLGFLSGNALRNEIRKSMFVVLPSECYENNPRTIIEGFALGKPAVASRTGGIPELVLDNRTGLTYEVRNPEDLKAKLMQMLANTQDIPRMGQNGRMMIENELNEEIHYEKLIEIYESAIMEKRKKLRADVYDSITDKGNIKVRLDELRYRFFWLIGIMLSFVIYHTGIVWLYTMFRKKVLKKQNTIILMYHRVRDDRKTANISVSTNIFEKQMAYLKDNFDVIPLSDLVNGIELSTNSSQDHVAITFDDGYKDNYWNAFPILQKNNISATIFLVSSAIGKDKNMLNRDDILTMEKGRIEFGSHTVSHRVLRNIDTNTAVNEIFHSREDLARLLNKKVKFFSYPRGKRRHFSAVAKNLVKQAGYEAAFTTENGKITRKSDFFELNRIGIRNFPMYVFKTRVSGIFESALFLPIRRFVRLT
jgi:glycosyltransferase involved in cell wall biosynthesis/peptidoglycan/xylan/chitin deacetylase (PgdA/CDA1 family)